MAQWTGKRAKVSFSKPSEPSFLRDFKKRVGYKEDGGLSDKFADLPPATLEDLADGEDDLPQVVSTGRGALSAEECTALQEQGRLQQLLATGETGVEDRAAAGGSSSGCDGKILFRKPASKRGLEEDPAEAEVATVDDKPTATLKDIEKKKKKKKKQEEQKKKTLLSFDEDEDE